MRMSAAYPEIKLVDLTKTDPQQVLQWIQDAA
jgi:hypothetical protein